MARKVTEEHFSHYQKFSEERFQQGMARAATFDEGNPLGTPDYPHKLMIAYDDPQSVLAKEADFMRPGDHVIGMVVNGKARAYPLIIGNAWHLINDEHRNFIDIHSPIDRLSRSTTDEVANVAVAPIDFLLGIFVAGVEDTEFSSNWCVKRGFKHDGNQIHVRWEMFGVNCNSLR